MITLKNIKEILSYDPLTGIFTWNPREENSIGDKIFNARFANKETGSLKSDGYIFIRKVTKTNKYKAYLAHRLAWMYMYNEYPTADIDHINHIKSDNRISNLRLATESENLQNQIKAQKGNKSGFLGVHWCDAKQRYKATIKIQGKTHWLGTFKTAEEAHQKYLETKRINHAFCTI